MDIDWLVIIWLVGSGIGLLYSFRGIRDAWGDLLAVEGDSVARDLAAAAFKTQLVRCVIQLVWLLIGVIALLSIAGILVLWGLIATNYALAWLSREAYLTKRRTIAALMDRQAAAADRLEDKE